MKTIITHPGTAHTDEFLACCILAAKFEVTIERREPTQADLDDPETLVLDVGGQYNPAKLNFDHHHDLNLPCAFNQIVAWLGLEEQFRRAYKWFDNVDFRDRNGQKRLGDKYNLTDEQMAELASPIHTAILKEFGREEISNPMCELDFGEFSDYWLYRTMKEIGLDLISNADKYGAAWQRLETCERHNFRGYEVLVIPSDDQTATGDFARERKIDIIISHDNRGKGWSFFRTGTAEGLNLTPFEILKLAEIIPVR